MSIHLQVPPVSVGAGKPVPASASTLKKKKKKKELLLNLEIKIFLQTMGIEQETLLGTAVGRSNHSSPKRHL